MEQPDEFQYQIIIPGDADSPYLLDAAPKGWQDSTEVDFKRSETYYGSVKSLTVPLSFVLRGAFLLRREYFKYNVQAVAYIQINKFNTSTWIYELAYYGKIDFSKAKDSDDFFIVNAIDADMSVKIKAFENTKFEFPMDVPDAIDVLITPIKLVESADLLFVASQTDQQPGYPALTVINNEVKSVNQSVKDAGYKTELSPNFATDVDWFFTAQTTGVVNFKIDHLIGSVQNTTLASDRFRIQLVKSNGTALADIIDITIGPGAQGFDIVAEYSFTINEGERVFVYQRIDGALNSNTGFNYSEGTLSLSYDTVSPESTCKAFRPAYIFQQLVNKMNGGFYYPTQSFLLKEWEQLTITCGDAIRQLDGAKLKISFTDLFKSISGVTCAGHAVENGVATLEYRRSYYRASKSLSMLDSKDVEITSALDLMFNSITAGYKDQTYDEINGRDEVNSQQTYVIDTYAPVATLDITSTIRADAYGIEFLRINLDGKETTDSDSDNDPFFLFVEQNAVSGVYPVQTSGNAGAVITGVRAGSSYYNWQISPHNNLLRWGAWIHSVFYGNDGYQIRFASGLKNTAMTVMVNGQLTIESSNVQVSELAAPYFMPYYANFTTMLPYDFWRYINASVYGYGEFSYIGSVLKGYFIEASIDLAANSERDFKLLLTTDNNMLEFIR